MKPWKRYTIATVVVIWVIGNIPAWLFLGTYNGTGGGKSYYALFWTLVPFFAFPVGLITFFIGVGASIFVRWVIHGDNNSPIPIETRIAELENELGIGK